MTSGPELSEHDSLLECKMLVPNNCLTFYNVTPAQLVDNISPSLARMFAAEGAPSPSMPLRAFFLQRSTSLRSMSKHGARAQLMGRYDLVAPVNSLKSLSGELSNELHHSREQILAVITTSGNRRYRRWNRLMGRQFSKEVLTITASLLALETIVVASRRGSLIKPKTIVECRHGHRFTSLWVPGVSFKAIHFLWWRFQYCPVGEHFSLVTPVKVSKLADDELQLARSRHDINIP